MTYCYSMYKDGCPPEKGYPLPENITWKHIQDMVGKNKNAKFLQNGISATDVV